MKLANSDHPVWSLARFAIVGVVLTIVLAVNANDFDETEYKAIAEFLMLFGGVEGGIALWHNRPGAGA